MHELALHGDRRKDRPRGEHGRAGQFRPGQIEHVRGQRVFVRERGAGDRPIVRVQADAHAPAQQRRKRMA